MSAAVLAGALTGCGSKTSETQAAATQAAVETQKAAADTTGAAVGNSGSLQAGTGNVSYHKWIQDGANWRFELADGSRLSNCLVTIDGAEYAFNTEGIMLTGWQRSGDTWYCFEENGSGYIVMEYLDGVTERGHCKE